MKYTFTYSAGAPTAEPVHSFVLDGDTVEECDVAHALVHFGYANRAWVCVEYVLGNKDELVVFRNIGGRVISFR
jgi:hypothetical protein